MAHYRKADRKFLEVKVISQGQQLLCIKQVFGMSKHAYKVFFINLTVRFCNQREHSSRNNNNNSNKNYYYYYYYYK